ncbi:MAG: HIT family protein [Promethearchaeota archaeon]
MPINKEEHRKRYCAFCQWQKTKKEEAYRWLDDNEHYYVILPLGPKILGHVLVVAKDAYDDICDIEPDTEVAKQIFSAVVEWAHKIKEKLEDVQKIYVMTMCEHWELDEIKEGWTSDNPPVTTEHLHFHLIPRYKDKRTRELAMEHLLSRPEDEQWSEAMFRALKSKLQN